jgi:hypothetical protein
VIIIKNITRILTFKLNITAFFLLAFLLLHFSFLAQTVDSLAYSKYKFINTELNRIENDNPALTSFYEQLYQLQQSKRKRVNIIHIGDSHIQADFFSGTIRQKMQLKFGNAGRGLIFPYRVAKSNEPSSYKTTTNKVWDSKRNVYYDKPLPIGISGFTVETSDSLAEINLTLKDQPNLGYAFTKFTLFHDRGINNYDITVCDGMNCEKGIFKSSDKSNNSFISELKFDSPQLQIILHNKCSDTSCQRTTRIYGMLLENDSAGVLYNMIGVNGAEYRHYNMSKYFIQQLPVLNPDLIIVSLGTNEAFSMGFDKETFRLNIDTLINNIKFTNPQAAIILTTPGDSFRKSRKGRVKNPDMKIAKEIIIEYCKKNNLAYWDLYEIMGGFGSMQKWFTAQLSAKDKVHLNSRGYQIEGTLFYEALMDGYEKYCIDKK